MVEPEAGPVARALLALELIQGNPGITAERLGRRLGVSERAARRYVSVLRDAGIPIESLRGRYGGYRAGRGLRLPPLVFSSEEALGLVMGVLDGHHDVRDRSDPVATAIGKIVRSLPEHVAAQAEVVARTAAAATDQAAVRPDPGTASTLVQACASRRRARIRYRPEGGDAWDTEVEPWAVVVRHGRWYLLCRSVRSESADDGVRAYRVDRVEEVEVLPATFQPPEELDPVGALEEHLATGWRYAAEVVVEAPLEVVVRHLPRTLGRAEAMGPGTTRVVGSTSNPAWYVEQLVAAPTAFRVLGGPEVREAARVLGQRLLDAVSGSTPGGTVSGTR